jgi:hypothetical protein
MMTHLNPVHPPRFAAWLVNLFTLPNNAESIPGDLLEEFSQIAAESGPVSASRWYWRQVLKTIVHLAGAAFRSAPAATTAAVVGGFLLRKLLAPVPGEAIFAVLRRYQIFDSHFGIYLFFASTGIDIGHVLVFLLVGCAVAMVARGREMAATTALALIFGLMVAFSSVVILARGGDPLLWRLLWYFADSFAIVLGGVIVRTRRSAGTILAAGA